MNPSYQPVIGLEIHVELKTVSGMFCRCKVNQFTSEPNSHVCPVCLGMPGALPVPNKQAVEWTIKIGQALNCTINKHTKFDRKHYSYPDLAKGYQISQYDEPIATKGSLKIKVQRSKIPTSPAFGGIRGVSKNASQISKVKEAVEEKVFRIHRVHLEEDTGKLIHRGDDTLVDFNRSGTPLVEIVTEPDFESADDVKIFLEELHTIIRYLDVSDADMEKGTMRMEPNISVREIRNSKIEIRNKSKISNYKLPNYKVEVKNINSFNFVKKAIEYEVKRHIEILEKGETPVQETRGWDSIKNITYSQRSKEEAHDYRYFPEPDIPPFEFSDEYLESVRKTIPELPQQKMDRYIKDFKLKESDAYTITRNKKKSYFYEEVMSKVKSQSFDVAQDDPERSRMGQKSKVLASLKLRRSGQVKSQNLEKDIANIIINKKISSSLSIEEFSKKVIELLMPQETDNVLLETIIESVLKNNAKSVTDYKSGKQNAIMFLVGQVMKEMKGKADAKIVISKLKELLK